MKVNIFIKLVLKFIKMMSYTHKTTSDILKPKEDEPIQLITRQSAGITGLSAWVEQLPERQWKIWAEATWDVDPKLEVVVVEVESKWIKGEIVIDLYALTIKGPWKRNAKFSQWCTPKANCGYWLVSVTDGSRVIWGCSEESWTEYLENKFTPAPT